MKPDSDGIGRFLHVACHLHQLGPIGLNEKAAEQGLAVVSQSTRAAKRAMCLRVAEGGWHVQGRS